MTITPEQQQQLLVPIAGAITVLGGVGRTTVYELIGKGEIVKVCIGRRAFITAESLAAYVDRLTQAARTGDSDA